MAILPDDVRHRSEPRISANDLAKYMVTIGLGRIGIIRRARDSIVPPRARYSSLRSALKAYLTDPVRRRSVLDTLGTNLEQRMSDSSLSNFTRQDAELSRDVDGRMRLDFDRDGPSYELAVVSALSDLRRAGVRIVGVTPLPVATGLAAA